MLTRAELDAIQRAFNERTPKRLLIGETRLLFQHIEELERRVPVRCLWCAKHPGLIHCGADGLPLFNLNHHAGKYVTPDESDRISADGP